jgi:AcrR family transcriptional regulator
MAQRTDGRVERGNQTRRAILGRSMQIASVEGLAGLSLGRVATELEISKSGVFALFGSMEELQLATVRAAIAVFVEHVVTPSAEMPAGPGRLWGICRDWIAYSRGRVFEGGCFFATVSAEFDARAGGPIRDLVASANRDWLGFLESTAADGIAAGSMRAGTDPAQLAFELNAFLDTANMRSLLHGDDAAYDRAAVAISDRLRAAATDPAAIPPPG